MYLDPKGKDASLLDKKIKEHIAESQSRKQKEGRKKSNTGGSWKQRRFVELHEQIERLVAELPPAKERTEEQKAAFHNKHSKGASHQELMQHDDKTPKVTPNNTLTGDEVLEEVEETYK